MFHKNNEPIANCQCLAYLSRQLDTLLPVEGRGLEVRCPKERRSLNWGFWLEYPPRSSGMLRVKHWNRAASHDHVRCRRSDVDRAFTQRANDNSRHHDLV